jgi:hypothetical protein
LYFEIFFDAYSWIKSSLPLLDSHCTHSPPHFSNSIWLHYASFVYIYIWIIYIIIHTYIIHIYICNIIWTSPPLGTLSYIPYPSHWLHHHSPSFLSKSHFHHYYHFRPRSHIWMKFDFLTFFLSIRWPPVPHIFLQATWFHSSLWQNNNPLCILSPFLYSLGT